MAVASAVLLAGCTKNSIEESGVIEAPDNGGGLTDLELASVNSTGTKAVIEGTDFPQTGEIGLFLFKDETATTAYGDGYANIQYSYNSDKKKWTATPSIKVGSTPGYLYGYYPYKESNTNIKAIPVSSSLNGDDVMYASKQAEPITDKTAANTSITMNHALARVAITVINKGYTGNAELSQIKFAGAKIAGSGTLDATSGKITATKADDVTLSVPEAVQTIATGNGTTYECLLVPSGEDESKQTVTLTLTIDGNNKTAILSGNDNGVIIAQGAKSNITIGLSNTGIAVQTVSVEDWNIVEVGGHKVTVKFADDVTPHDILTEAYVDGNNVIIKATSFQGKRLICNVGGDAQCERAITSDKFTFTISEISSDIEAVLGYAPLITLTVTSDSNGKVWIGDDKNKTTGQFEQGEQVVIHATPNDNFNLFGWNDNSKESSRTITIGATDVTYSASFIPQDAIPGLFTVDANKKKVFFSKGNLYYNGATFNFEANQYDTTPSSNDNRVEDHISHFMWCDNATNAVVLKYNDGWNGTDKSFFAAKNFTVNGYSGWGVLTGGANGEWAYLLNTRKTTYGTGTLSETNRRYAAVKVNGMAGLLIFTDDFSWPKDELLKNKEPQTFNANSSNWNGLDYTVAEFTVLQNNGCVFLPAAGFRSGDIGDAFVSNVGSSATTGPRPRTTTTSLMT